MLEPPLYAPKTLRSQADLPCPRLADMLRLARP